MLREPTQRHPPDALASQAQSDERERSQQWRTELDTRAEQEIPLHKVLVDDLPSDAYVVNAYRARYDHHIVGAALYPFGNVTASAADYATVRVIRHSGDGSALAAARQVAILNTSRDGWTTRAQVDMQVDPNAGKVLAGEWVVLHVLKSGTGVLLPAFVISLAAKRRQSWR